MADTKPEPLIQQFMTGLWIAEVVGADGRPHVWFLDHTPTAEDLREMAAFTHTIN